MREILKCAMPVLCLWAGCQSAFQRDADYGTPARKDGNDVIPTVSLTDRLRLISESVSAEAEARFSCDVQRPVDVLRAHWVDLALDKAYCHARGEERHDVTSKGVRGVRDAFFDDYREWFEESRTDIANGDVPLSVAGWTCHVQGRLVHGDKACFSYRVIIDTYCGGAHPNRWIQNITFSRTSQRRLKVADIIKPESKRNVVNRIRSALRRETHDDEALQNRLAGDIVQSYDAYARSQRDGWDNPLVTENFLLTKDGIVWTYNQYEIACYASGTFDALVPWRELQPYLTATAAQMWRGASMPSK